MSGTFTSEALRLAAWVRRFDIRAEETAQAIANAELNDVKSRIESSSAANTALAERLAEAEGRVAGLLEQRDEQAARVAGLEADADRLQGQVREMSEQAVAFRAEAGRRLDNAFAHLREFQFDAAAKELANASEALTAADWSLILKQLTAVAQLAGEGVLLHERLLAIVALIKSVRETGVDGLLDSEVDEFARDLARASGSRLSAAYTIAHQVSDLPAPANNALRENFIKLGQALHEGWYSGFASVGVEQISASVEVLANVILEQLPQIARRASLDAPAKFTMDRKRPRSVTEEDQPQEF